MAYPTKFRELVIKKIAEGKTYRELSQQFNISQQTIANWLNIKKETNNLDKSICIRSHRKIDPNKLRDFLIHQPDLYDYELAEKFNCSSSAIFFARKKLGFTRKKRTTVSRTKS